MSVLILYPNQLYRATLSLPKQNVQVLLVEDEFHFGPTMSPDELLQFRASMRAFRERLLVKGFAVEYVETAEIATLPEILKKLAGATKQVASYALGVHPLAAKHKELLRTSALKCTELPTPGIFFSKEYAALQMPALRRSLVTLPEFGEPDRYIDEAIEYVGGLRDTKTTPIQRLPIAYSDAGELVEHAVVTTDEAARKLIQRAVAWSLYQGLLTPAAIAETVAEHGAFHKVPTKAQERLLRFLLGDTEYRWLKRGR